MKRCKVRWRLSKAWSRIVWTRLSGSTFCIRKTWFNVRIVTASTAASLKSGGRVDRIWSVKCATPNGKIDKLWRGVNKWQRHAGNGREENSKRWPTCTTSCLRSHVRNAGSWFRKMEDVLICNVQNANMNSAGNVSARCLAININKAKSYALGATYSS